MHSIELILMFDNNDDFVDIVIGQDDCMLQILATMVLIHQRFSLEINVNRIINSNLNDVQH